MRFRNCLMFIFTFLALMMYGCSDNGPKKMSDSEKIQAKESQKAEKNEAELEKLNKIYRNIPDERILDNNGAASPLYGELKDRYKKCLTDLKTEVEATGAKFIVVIIKPVETPDEKVRCFKAGRSYIVSLCGTMGIDCYDFSDQIDKQNIKDVTLMPADGHWSKKGSEFLASLMYPVLEKYKDARSKVVYKDNERAETFGDLNPNDDQFLDGGKNLPYHLKANAQGLRMNYDLKFPKTKQRILFFGSSHIYSPFLDNENIMTSVLQKQMPEAEVLNAGLLSASIDDYVTLFDEKSKYAEPDIVVVQTNGGDIIHLYFSNRNRVSRNKTPRNPTPLEEKYYDETYGKP